MMQLLGVDSQEVDVAGDRVVMNQDQNESRMADLIERYYLDSLSDAEHQELVSALGKHRTWRDRFRRSARLDALLRYMSAAQPHADNVGTSATTPTMEAAIRGAIQSNSVATKSIQGAVGWRGNIFLQVATLVAAVTFVVLAINPGGNDLDPQPAAGATRFVEKVDHGVAFVGGTVDAVWSGVAWRTGMSVPRGRIELESGLAQIEFYSGATVILEGPARLDLRSTNDAILISGKLSANVPVHARGFEVRSVDTRLVDLGTEFAMEVTADRGTEIHVFDGEVEIFPPHGSPDLAAARSLKAVEARRIIKGMMSDNIDPAPHRFVVPRELEQRISARSTARLELWRNSMNRAAADARTVAYYPFDYRQNQPRRLVHGLGQSSNLDGTIVGARWSDGRWSNKNALDFKRPGDRVRITVPEKYVSITLAAWVRVDGLDNVFSSLLLSEGWNRPGAVHWQIHKKGWMELSVWNGPNDEEHDSIAEFILLPSDFGRWMHLAVVYDGMRGIVTHYCDGIELGAVQVKPTVAIEISDAQIGNWNPLDWSDPTPIRNFSGRIDEFAIFGVALDPDEIRALFEAGNVVL